MRKNPKWLTISGPTKQARRTQTQAEIVADLKARVEQIESREPNQAAQRLNEIESKLPRRTMIELRGSMSGPDRMGTVGWDPEKNRFLKGWLDDHLPVAPPVLCDACARDEATFAKRLASFTLTVVLVGLFICGYEVSQLKRTLAKQSTGVPIVSGGPVGDSALEKANTWSVRQGPIASSSTAPESTVLSGDLTDNKPNQAVIVSRSGTAGAIDFGPTPGDGHQHNLQVSVSASCWLRVTEQTPAAKVLIDGFQKNGFMQTIEFDEGASLEVRSGCPGDVHYTVNGLIVHPDNVSGTPDKSEVVELRL